MCAMSRLPLVHALILLAAIVVTLRLLLTLWLLLTLRVCRAVVLATHCVNLAEVDVNLTTRHEAYIANYSLVVGMLVVVLVALATHIPGYIQHLGHGIWCLSLCSYGTHHLLGVLTIVLEVYA